MNTSPPGPHPGGARGADTQRLPPGLVAAAEQDYHRASDYLDQFIALVRALLAEGATDLEAALYLHQPGPGQTLMRAIAVVRLAKTATPGLGKARRAVVTRSCALAGYRSWKREVVVVGV